jgi:hypothetical protein
MAPLRGKNGWKVGIFYLTSPLLPSNNNLKILYAFPGLFTTSTM